MASLNVAQASEVFTDLVNRAVSNGERTIVSREGEPLAAIVPIEDLRLLERLQEEWKIVRMSKMRALPLPNRVKTFPGAKLNRMQVFKTGVSNRVSSCCPSAI